jgi:hypothetical protein
MALAIEDTEYAHQQSNLDKEWQSQRKQLRYAKPSSGLLNLRYRAQQMIITKRFAGMGDVTQLMHEMIEKESADAARKLNHDYRQADANLRKTYDKDRSTLVLAHETRLNNIVRERGRSLTPHATRYQKMQERVGELSRLASTPQPDIVIPPPKLPNCDNALLATLNKPPRLKMPVVQPIPRGQPRTTTRKSSRTSASAVSGLEVSSGTGKL